MDATMPCSLGVRGTEMPLPSTLKALRAVPRSMPHLACSRPSYLQQTGRRALHTAAAGAAHSAERVKQSGYMYHEQMFWHCAGPWGNFKEHVQPMTYPENSETKRRLHNLVIASGLFDELKLLKPRQATVEEIARVHTLGYVQSVQQMSADYSKNIHRVGDETAFMPGGFDIAALAAGGAITATDEVLKGHVANAYALTRPPGHHAESHMGGGYCIFNNIAIAALHALKEHQLDRVAIVDFDVHHGNGTQQIFEEDNRVLFISVHQAGNYPLHSGNIEEVGKGHGVGTTLNIPLPPGSGSGAYRAVFDRVVGPALDAFQPQLILVSAGYDASYMDPLGHMMLGSEDYRYFTALLKQHAESSPACQGRMVACHEGGYSDLYVPFCGLAVIEEMAGKRTKVSDPYWEDVSNFAYQDLQPHQDAVVQAAERQLRLLVKAVGNVGSENGSISRNLIGSKEKVLPGPWATKC